MNVIAGGTFAYMHKGHRKLLKMAFKAGGNVNIGLTSDSYVRLHKVIADEDYKKRKKNLERFAKHFNKRFRIIKLNDHYGPSTSGNFQVIVVSKETNHTAKAINRIRKKRGLKPLKIIVIDYVMAYDKRPISSSRIASGEIDINGKRIKRKRNNK